MKNIKKNNKAIQRILHYHQQHPWVWIYLMALLVLIIWGNLSVRILPLVEFNISLPADLSYESVAPGWASQGVVRSFLEPWLRWDAAWYLLIAKNGYSVSGNELAFLPLYPVLTRFLGALLGDQILLASLIISWGAVFGICFLLEERFRLAGDQQTAVRGIRNLLFFPTAIFFFSGYTEALFLFLVLIAWRYADRQKWLLAGLVGGLATLTRFMGVLLLLPFGLIWLKNWRENKLVALFALFPIPLTYFGWDMFTRFSLKTQPYIAQTQGWSWHFDWPWAGVMGSLQKIFNQTVSESFSAYIDVFAVLIVIISITYWVRKKAYPEALFMTVVILISLMKITNAGYLGSVSRFVIPLFPMYLMLSEIGSHKKYDRVILITSIFLWLFCAAMFFSWNWLA